MPTRAHTTRDDFFSFLADRDYSLSYKMPFLLSFLNHMDRATGEARGDDVLDDYIAFYRDRIARGLVVNRQTCPYNADTLQNRKFIQRNMLADPFERFERKRFMYHSKDLGVISINHALQHVREENDHSATWTREYSSTRSFVNGPSTYRVLRSAPSS